MDKQIKELLEKGKLKDLHYNKGERHDWTSGTGSISLDMFMDGGNRPGIFRISGEFESGKTSFAINLAKIFQTTVENSFVVYINAEGRVTPEMIERIGVDTSEKRWFCFDSNYLEGALGLIRELCTNNKDEKKYLFIMDSSDALIRKDDEDSLSKKGFNGPQKIAGGASVFSVAGKALSLPISRFGHSLIILSQNRTKMNTQTGIAGNTQSGGKALGYYSSTIAEIQRLWTDLYIWENPSAGTIKEKGKKIGHYCVMRFTKTRNEKTGQEVAIPIKYDKVNGAHIWKEREVYDLAIAWEFLSVKGAGWHEFSDDVIEELKSKKIEIPQKIQGEKKVVELFEQDPKLTEFFEEKFRSLI
jgi:RecA/RadA recombinase